MCFLPSPSCHATKQMAGWAVYVPQATPKRDRSRSPSDSNRCAILRGSLSTVSSLPGFLARGSIGVDRGGGWLGGEVVRWWWCSCLVVAELLDERALLGLDTLQRLVLARTPVQRSKILARQAEGRVMMMIRRGGRGVMVTMRRRGWTRRCRW
jgi:hypothetical protein